MPFSTEVQTAIANLKTLYNGDAYDAGTNPGGMGEGGHRQNFEPALTDVGITGEAVGSAADIVQTQSDDVATRSTEFRSRFLGAAAAPPSQDGNGDPVTDGALYWDSNTDTLRVFSNGAWEAPAAAATDYVPASTGGTFTGAVNAAGGITGDLSGNVTGDLTGNVLGDVTGNVSGNAGTATALETGRTITIDGAVDASASFDGTGDITLTATVDHNSHNHLLANITDAGTMAAQDANAVDIDGGAIDGVAIGETTRGTAKITTLDANAAATFGTTLDVTGATTLSATLDVTGQATFTAQSVHPAGVSTNLVQGADGTLVLNADAGDNIEIQVDGVKKADITADGDVIASRHARANSVPYFSMQWSGAGGVLQDIADNSANIAIDAADVDDPDGLFDHLAGVFTAPVDGVYYVSMAFTSTAARELSFLVDEGSGFTEQRILATSGSFASGQNSSFGFMYRLSAGDKAKLRLNNNASSSKNGTMFSIGLIA